MDHSLKEEVRKRLKIKLRELQKSGELKDLGLKITLKLEEFLLQEATPTDTFGVYAPMKDEFDIVSNLSSKLQSKLCFPKFISDGEMIFIKSELKDLAVSYEFGPAILVPKLDIETKPTMLIVPAIGFSRLGQRIGRGGGYYDRYLATNPDVIKVGVTSERLIENQLPTEGHDIEMDYIVLENEIIKIRKKTGI